MIVVAASVAVQTHVGTVPAVALLLLTLGPLALWRWHRDRVAWRRPVLAGLLVLAVMWALPVLQQVTGHPGNLSEIADFFTTRGGAHHSLSDALRVTGPQLTLNRGRLFSSLSRARSDLGFARDDQRQGDLPDRRCGGRAAVNVYRRRWFCAGLCVAGLAGTAGAVLGAQRIVGPVFGYLTSSALSMGLVLWLAVGATVTAELARIRRDRAEPARYAIAVVLVVALVGASLLLARVDAGANLFATKRPNSIAARLVRNVRTLSRPGSDGAVFIEPQTGTQTWSLAAMVANQLERDGITVHTPHTWEFLFGSQRTGGAGDATHIRFVDVRLHRTPRPTGSQARSDRVHAGVPAPRSER